MKRFILLISCLLSCWNLQAQVKTLKDSLLEMYSIEELKSMTSRERGNVIRKLRGQEPLPDIPKESEYDFYGIKVIHDIPVDSMIEVVERRINQIESEKRTYRQEVFPNAWRDVVDGYYGLHFYKSLTDRIVDVRDRETIASLINETEGSSPFSNFSKRTYFFNSNDELRLIVREAGYNINEGQKYNWDYRPPLVYLYEEYYVWDGVLFHSTGLEAEQAVAGYPNYATQDGIDSALVKCEAFNISFYKDNSFNYSKKSGVFELNQWQRELENTPFAKQPDSANGTVVLFRNLISEREEYYAKLNDYLQPVPTSFLAPYFKE